MTYLQYPVCVTFDSGGGESEGRRRAKARGAATGAGGGGPSSAGRLRDGGNKRPDGVENEVNPTAGRDTITFY